MRSAILALLVLMLTGCVGGQMPLRPQNEKIILGKSSYDEVVKSYGEPRLRKPLFQNNSFMEQIAYAHAVGVPLTTILSTRSLIFSFHEGVLVGYDYVSSFDEDKSDNEVKEDAIKHIRKGDDRGRVSLLLGKPHGEFIFPFVEKKGYSSLKYYSSITSSRVPLMSTVKMTARSVTFVLDVNGIVTDIETSELKPN